MKGWGFVKDSAMKEPPPPVGQQAGNTHPTGMHSCSDDTFPSWNDLSPRRYLDVPVYQITDLNKSTETNIVKGVNNVMFIYLGRYIT